MKKYISIVLAFIILINIESYYLIYSILSYQVKQEIWEKIWQGISEKDLVLIIVSDSTNSGIFWIEKNKEFLYKWTMYDVVKIDSDKYCTRYYCVNDEKECQLIDNYQKSRESKNANEKHLKKIPYLEFIPSKTFLTQQFQFKGLINKAFISNYKFSFIKIPSPPPKVI